MNDKIFELFGKAEQTLSAFCQVPANIQTIGDIVDALADAFKRGNKVIIFGNGGSMCDAMHFAEELAGRFRTDRPPLPAMAISDPSYITCVANDYGFEEIFSRGVSAFAKPKDIVIGISTSGNSQNVIRAINTAKELDCVTIALLGKDGGALKEVCDYELIVPAVTTDRIQEVHIKILHIIVELVETKLF